MAGGRPRKYSSPEEMQHAIDLYFLACKIHQEGEKDYLLELSNEDKAFIKRVDDIYPSVTGLALALGFTSRQSLIDYEERDEYFDTIKNAKLKVENNIEQRLFFQHSTGSIFNLKNNFGWKDQKEIDNKSSDGSMTPKAISDSDREILSQFIKQKEKQ